MHTVLLFNVPYARTQYLFFTFLPIASVIRLWNLLSVKFFWKYVYKDQRQLVTWVKEVGGGAREVRTQL